MNNKTNVIMQARNNSLGSYNITFANNIIQGGNTAVDIKGSLRILFGKEILSGKLPV